MHRLTTQLVGRACRLFMDLAYPGGPETMPPAKRIYHDLPDGEPMSKFLPPAPAAVGVCQVVPPGETCRVGYAFRLGSAHFPNLKLSILLVEEGHDSTWVYMVDTHDAFSQLRFHPPTDHPDAAAWLALQATNRRLKEQIETALEDAGFVTFAALLKRELT